MWPVGLVEGGVERVLAAVHTDLDAAVGADEEQVLDPIELRSLAGAGILHTEAAVEHVHLVDDGQARSHRGVAAGAEAGRARGAEQAVLAHRDAEGVAAGERPEDRGATADVGAAQDGDTRRHATLDHVRALDEGAEVAPAGGHEHDTLADPAAEPREREAGAARAVRRDEVVDVPREPILEVDGERIERTEGGLAVVALDVLVEHRAARGPVEVGQDGEGAVERTHAGVELALREAHHAQPRVLGRLDLLRRVVEEGHHEPTLGATVGAEALQHRPAPDVEVPVLADGVAHDVGEEVLEHGRVLGRDHVALVAALVTDGGRERSRTAHVLVHVRGEVAGLEHELALAEAVLDLGDLLDTQAVGPGHAADAAPEVVTELVHLSLIADCLHGPVLLAWMGRREGMREVSACQFFGDL